MGIISRLIEIKYQNAQNCAQELETVANVINSLADNDIGEVLHTTDAAWDGEASILCCRKIDALQKDVKNTGKSISNAAYATRIISDNVHKAELITMEIAYKRGY